MQDGPHARVPLLASRRPTCSPLGDRVSSSGDTQRARIRAAMKRADPDMLEFVDMARGIFPGARMIQLDLPTEGISIRQPASPGALSPRWKDRAERKP